MAKKNNRIAWHFLARSRQLGYGDGRKVNIGEKLSTPDLMKRVEICGYGMHASPNICSALRFAYKLPILTRVIVQDELDVDPHVDYNGNPEKLAGRHRTVLWMKHLPKDVMVAALKLLGTKPSEIGFSSWSRATWEDLRVACDLRYSRKSRVIERFIRKWAYENGCPR